MRFFNIDLHVSVIADIERIFRHFGHTVDINYLSNHSWVFNKTPNNSFCINQNNWRGIDQKMCDDFYNENKYKLDKYDGFIVTHIPALSLLYEKFNKPIIFVSSTRYEYPFTDDYDRWCWLNNYINTNNNIIPVTNNLYDKWYCEQFLDKNFEYIPSICEYTDERYDRGNNLSLLYSKHVNLKSDLILNKEVLGRYEWNQLFKYKSIIHIPYNVSTMSIFEHYTANIPLFFPSKDLIFNMLPSVFTEISYTQVLNTGGGSIIRYKYDIDPNNINRNLIEKCVELSDFYGDDMKNIMYFDDISDLIYKLNNVNLDAVSSSMSEHNLSRKETIYTKWGSIINML